VRAIFAACIAMTAAGAEAAFLSVQMTPEGIGVNDIVHARLLIHPGGVYPGAPDGPGTVRHTLEWGSERSQPHPLGSLALFRLPTAGSVGSLTYGADCIEGIWDLVGACTIVVELDQAITQTETIADVFFVYDWIPEDGWEVCDGGPGWETCEPAGQTVAVTGDATLFGVLQEGIVAVTGSLGEPRVREVAPQAVPLGGVGRGALGIALAVAALSSRRLLERLPLRVAP
jgi:hypothetical protein